MGDCAQSFGVKVRRVGVCKIARCRLTVACGATKRVSIPKFQSAAYLQDVRR